MTPIRTVLPILAAFALAGCLPEREEASEQGEGQVRTVRTKVVQMASPISVRSFPAVLEPEQITPLAFDVGGRLGPVTLQIGQEVRAGEVLAEVESQDAHRRLQQAEAALAEAVAAAKDTEDELDRQQQLYDRGVASAAARDRAATYATQAAARVEQQSQALELLRETLADTALRAPFDGVVNTIEVQNFGTVAAGQPVVSLYQDGGLTATILVNYEMASSLSLGQAVRVVPHDGAPRSVDATVTEIARRAPAVSSFPVIVTLGQAQPDLRPGMAVDVEVDQPLAAHLRGMPVPVSALATQRPADLRGPGMREADVFIFVGEAGETGVVAPRRVQIGAVFEDRVILTGGVKPGERIVTAGVPFLHPGQAVRLEEGVEMRIAEASR